MAKLTIEITENAHLVLKERAKSEERSLAQYITLLLDDVTDTRHLLVNSYTLTKNTTKNTATDTATDTITDTTTDTTKRKEIFNYNDTEEDIYSKWK